MNRRETPIEMSRQEFASTGHKLVDIIAHFIHTIDQRLVTTTESAALLQQAIGNGSLPDEGAPATEILHRAANLLLDYSLLNGHPKFLGYITSSPAPIGALADLLAASINPNVGAQILSPVATEIEKQTISWLSEFIGLSAGYGGILVSGGNMANFTAFLAARTAKATVNIKEHGIAHSPQMLIYCSKATHTWIEKAAVLFGHGTQSIRWIETDDNNRMINEKLESAIQKDIQSAYKPFIVIGTAGDVSTGAVDDLAGIASICKAYDIWFHIDGAYGIPAAVINEMKPVFNGIHEADSIALDPHKWLYSPLEAGCTLVKNPRHLTDTYSSHPDYYNFSGGEGAQVHNFYEYGLQNSRGFRALKVWLVLQQAGKNGYAKMIAEDIRLSKHLFTLASQHNELEAVTQSLSITTMRYVPADLMHDEERESYLNRLNETLLNELQKNGEVFLSNAVVSGRYCLRACIVNFRTSQKDIEEIVEIVVREGKKMHARLRESIAV